MISILIPLYNSSFFIAETITSVISQDYQNFELLIYDDCSTDNSVEVVSKFNDNRIKLYKGIENFGVRHARDFLLEKAKGDFICFLDSDDICYRTRFIEQIKFLQENPTVDILGTAVKFIDEKSNSIFFPLSFQANNSEEIVVNLFFCNTIATSTVMFRNKVKNDIKFSDFPYNIAEDYYVWFLLSKKYSIVNLKKALVFYRVSNGSLMHSCRTDYRDALNLIHLNVFDTYNINKSYLDVHNRYLYANINSRFYLKKSIVYFDILINLKLMSNKSILLRQIRFNWFRRCINFSKQNQLEAFIYYFKYFKHHNFYSIFNGGFLSIICLYHYVISNISLKKAAV